MEKGRERRFRQWNKARIRTASTVPDSSGSGGFLAYTFDLSLGGAKIYSPRSFSVGTVLRIRLDLVRSRQSVSVDAEVKWSRRNEIEKVYEIGVEFTHTIPQTALSLMKNLFDESAGIPTLVSSDTDPEKSR